MANLNELAELYDEYQELCTQYLDAPEAARHDLIERIVDLELKIAEGDYFNPDTFEVKYVAPDF